jgi:hypothetical protein
VLATSGLAACGSTGASPGTASRSADASRSAAAPIAATTPASGTALPPCSATVAGTLAQVAQNVYRDAASGEDVAEAVQRVSGSQTLASAIGAGSTRAVDRSLRALLLGQIVRIEILVDRRVLGSAGSGAAIAPVRGTVTGTDGTFVLSVQSDHGYVEVTHQVTGAQMEISSVAGGRAGEWLAGTVARPTPADVPDSGGLDYEGVRYRVASLRASAFPAGAARIAVLVAAPEISCAKTPAQTRVATLGQVGERIYEEELSSPTVRATVRKLERSNAFREAVAERSPAATRAAIVGFFEAHLHVVRVRVTVAGRLLIDVGGPYVLAPVRGVLRSHGQVVGEFEMAIQDDAGYLKLARVFTGAQVLMRVGARQLKGTLSPGPASVPGRGAIVYGGRRYAAYSFTAQAFPSGPLRISLLIHAS